MVWSAPIVRGPAIGRPDDSSIAVVWWTDSPSSSRVDYAAPFGAWSTVESPEAVTRHVVALSRLTSGRMYRYRVLSDGVPLADECTFRAPRMRAESSVRFGVIGDTATGHIPERIADRLVESDVDLVIHTGDVVYPHGAESMYDQEFFRPFAKWLARGPVLPTLGNHDVHTDEGAPLLANFVLPKNSATGEPRFYSFTQGTALFVCLDVETSSFGYGSTQYRWLVETLARSSALWKFVYFHEPPYSSAHANNVVRLLLAPVFERFEVDVVFSGHEHLYERTHPIHEFGFPGPGVVYVTEGGGGANLDGFRPQSYSAFAAARHGYLLGVVSAGRLELSAHDPDGIVFDAVVLEKPSAGTIPEAGAPNRAPRVVRRP